jgi:cytochrome c-type biogenesis protein CcmH
MKIIYLIILLLGFAVLEAQAAEDIYQFTTPAQKTRFQNLTHELRCLVCQNQNLAESNAPLASDLRYEIYQQIQSGQSNQEIISYLVARYGAYILYKPPLNSSTWGLWFGPLLFLLSSLMYLLFYLRKNKAVISC